MLLDQQHKHQVRLAPAALLAALLMMAPLVVAARGRRALAGRRLLPARGRLEMAAVAVQVVDMVRAAEGVLGKLKRSVSRQQAKLSGRTCDECGVLGAELLAKRGLTLQQCSRCKAAWYCGPRCQKAAWKARHKDECSA